MFEKLMQKLRMLTVAPVPFDPARRPGCLAEAVDVKACRKIAERPGAKLMN